LKIPKVKRNTRVKCLSSRHTKRKRLNYANYVHWPVRASKFTRKRNDVTDGKTAGILAGRFNCGNVISGHRPFIDKIALTLCDPPGDI